jgi:glucose-1-phosphate cytidylyltransferase
MKVLILAGGKGTRLLEETGVMPKPMVQIGDKPILWHIMKYYSTFGFNEFVILLGYKGYQIKEYFANYSLHQNDVSIDLGSNKLSTFKNNTEPWKVTLLETGQETMTGARIKMAKDHVGNQTFMLTYGDGLADVDLAALVAAHKHSGKALTVTAVQPESRFGVLTMDEDGNVSSFTEKPADNGSWINGGFFVCEPEVFNYIGDSPDVIFEQQPMRNLALEGKMHARKHYGNWKCMDTQRDNIQLNDIWNNQGAFWKVWK